MIYSEAATCFALLVLFLIFVLSISTYIFFACSYTYWKRCKVPYLKPSFPLGNNDCIGFEQYSYGREAMDWYNEIKRRGWKYGGVWSWSKPVLVLTDPALIKRVLLKNFTYFADRDFFHNPKYEPKNENLFSLEGEEVWKTLRVKVTPMFTGAKMRMMFDSIIECSRPMMERFERASRTDEDLNIMEITAAFTTDVIGCVVFGLEFGSFRSDDAPFRKMGKELFRSTWTSKVSLLLSRIAPKTAQNIGITNIPTNVTEFFAHVIEQTVQYRRKNNIVKNDFMQLLMDLNVATERSANPFTFNELIGNLITFFIAGFDTSATTLHFALYELARQPQVQDRAREEIRRILQKHDGQLTYDGFQEMTYMRQIIDESLRMYPAVQTLTRVCVKPYPVEDDFTLDKGITVIISALALGRDPDYYPDPNRFDPERFNSENKASRDPFVYLPFGEGPRNCIGERFGLMQTSIGLIRILKDYKLTISPNTKMPVSFRHGVFLMQPDNTLYVKAERATS